MVSKKILAFALGIGLAVGASSNAFAMSDEGVVDGDVILVRSTAARYLAADDVILRDVLWAYLVDAIKVLAVLSVMTDPRVAECDSLLSKCQRRVLQGACEFELKSLADEVDAKLRDLYDKSPRFRDVCRERGFNPFSLVRPKRVSSYF